MSLKQAFQHNTSEAELLKSNLSKAEYTLEKAESLLSKLSGEKERWKTQVGALSQDLNNLPKSSILSAAFIAYLPAQTEQVRKAMQKVD